MMNWNEQTNHAMIDLETLGMDNDAIILSAGIVVFNSQDIVATDYVEFNWTQPNSSVAPGTIQFWMGQVIEGKKIPQGGAEISQLAPTFNRIYKDHNCETLWANGIDFDIPKLNYHFDIARMETPWKYNAVRDCRTVFKLFEKIEIPADIANMNKHDALSDALFQVEKLQYILNNLQGRLN